MIVAGPALVSHMVKTNSGKKLYDRVQKEFPIELWDIVLFGISEIEEELRGDK